MNSGLVNYDWDQISNYEDTDITYFLYLEGKSIEAISKIRGIDTSTIQKHLIEGKIKYRFLEKSDKIEEFFEIIFRAGKKDKILVLEKLDHKNKAELIEFIKKSYITIEPKKKECAVWILGELKDVQGINILIKASVHKHVNIRRMAISALGKIGDIRAEDTILRALEDVNSQVVLYAIKSLKKLNSIKALSKIRNISETSNVPYLKAAAIEYLKEEKEIEMTE